MTSGDDVQLVTFRVGTQEFAFDILQVERILRYAQPAGVPRAPAFLEGVLPFEGGVLPVVDLRKRLEAPASVADETRVIVIGLEGERVGVVVDAVHEVLRVDAGVIAAPPAIVRGLAAEYITGVANLDGRAVVLLNARRLFTSAERLALQQAEA
ncbi:MAG TPA: chemotaxis protein CheW [Gemmatimonadales bacterium]|jgi:purine-binding chemotaxis protein CheW|nr:chemotaxis protein CheW [Gemmatimonadales bacterium]